MENNLYLERSGVLMGKIMDLVLEFKEEERDPTVFYVKSTAALAAVMDGVSMMAGVKPAATRRRIMRMGKKVDAELEKMPDM